MKKILNYRPIVLIAIFLMLGIFIGGLFVSNNAIIIFLSIAILIIGIILFVSFKKPIYFIVMLAIVIGIMAIFTDFKISNIKNFNEEKCFVSGRICYVDSDEIICDSLVIDGKKIKGKIEIQNFENSDEVFFQTGDKIDTIGLVSTKNNDIFSFYDMSEFDDRIYYNLEITQKIIITGKKITFNEKVKNNFIDVLYENCYKEEAGIILGLVFGDKSYLNYQDKTIINGIGMSHILAVSGLHIGFLFAIIIYINKKLRLKPFISLICVFVVWILYGILTGFPSGIKRAGIMSMVYMIGFLLIRKNDLLTTLSLSSIIILLTNPRELFTLGFILSISAVLGIISFAPTISKKILGRKEGKFNRYIADSIAISISANIFILPIMFNVFSQVAIYTILANLLILPLVSIGYVIVIIVALLSFIYKGLGVLYIFAQIPIALLRLIANFIYLLPYSTLEVYSMNVASISYLSGCFIATPYFMIEKTKKKRIILSCIIVSVILYFMAIIL